MLNMSYAGCRGLFPAISSFDAIHSSNVCRSPKSQKLLKTLYLGGSRSFKVIDVDTPRSLSLVFVSK